MSSTATGVVRKDAPFLVVVLARHTLRASKEFKTPTRVLEYRVGLAHNNAPGQWDVERWSESVPLALTMAPGDTKQLASATALILIDNIPSLQGAWLVLQLKVESGGEIVSGWPWRLDW